MVYDDRNVATDNVATEERARPTRTLERSGRKGVGREGRRRCHLADGRVAPANDAKRHNTIINPWGRVAMLLKIHLSGPAFGKG